MKYKPFLSALCIGLLASCGDNTSSSTTSASTSVNDTSAMPVASTVAHRASYQVLSYPYTPFVTLENKGQVSGLETDILRAIADNQKIQFQFTATTPQTSWKTLFDFLSKNQSQLLSAGMYANDERRERFEVSEPYMQTQFGFFSGKGLSVRSFADLKGKKVAYMPNSMAEKEIQAASVGDITVVPIKSLYEGVMAVVRGEADVLYGDGMVLRYYTEKFHADGVSFNFNDASKKQEFVFLITKGNQDLLKKVNDGLAAIQADGTLDKIKQKWIK